MSNTVNNCTSHPEGMLDRDQRTTFIFKTKSNEMIPLKCTICGCDDFKPNYIDIRRTYLNSNVNCDYLTSKNFSKKKVTRFFQSKSILSFLFVLFTFRLNLSSNSILQLRFNYTVIMRNQLGVIFI